ncbi:AbrB/MazE/SpoVT family DNA-binding domain-containing protein [Pelagibacterium halotolerans]|uniref:AbrB/MazE/SpoVT family DNA-binding domain-containing protein n=1 Tax=Pelagibacterium halotolerans TaxID=531813 RepID=UPI00384C59D6
MQANVAKWGNSIALRIPSAMAKTLHIEDGARVDLTIEEGVLVVRPIAGRKRYALDDLIGQITPENLHGETETGPARADEY